ncbi:MAG TPA: hypothetical protein VGS12_01230 [Caulobacteraceae bacterium]|nr:hypothetical protein [Caulobacteraceae bacterium]
MVGIIIAIGLEQTVEYLRHGAQRAQLEAALNRDGERNRGYIQSDIAAAEAVAAWAGQQAAGLERAGPSGPLILHAMPREDIGAPDAGVWPSAKASGLTNLLPSSAQNWLEYLAQVSSETFETPASAGGRLTSAYAALDQDLIGRGTADRSGNIELTALGPAQRARLVEDVRAVAERARTVVRKLVIYDIGNDFILSTPLDELDAPQATKHYGQIYQRESAAHPAAAYAFGGE